MSGKNESCWSGDESVGALTCLFVSLEDWLAWGNLQDYLSLLEYLLWVFTPLVIVFILPFVIVLLLYLSILFLHVYKRKIQLREAYSNNLWDGARKTLAMLWDGHGAIWHGYEIHGLEKIPEKGPALIVYYHGAIPIDYYYFLARVIIQQGRTCHSVADHFLFKVPGFKLLLEVFSVIHGPQEECVKALRSGHLLGISPGGVREALFSDETYPLLWGKRKGFAQVAIDSKVGFTDGCMRGFGCPSHLFTEDSQLNSALTSATLFPTIPNSQRASWRKRCRQQFKRLSTNTKRSLATSCERSWSDSTCTPKTNNALLFQVLLGSIAQHA